MDVRRAIEDHEHFESFGSSTSREKYLLQLEAL
jgi:hypothetical protein